MENEVVDNAPAVETPMDSESRTEAALAAFGGDSDPAPVDAPDPNAADPNADPNADPSAADPAPDPNAGQITDEQLQADPRYLELSNLRDSVANLATEFGIPLDDKGNPNLDETKAQLSDASILYQIMQGKGTPSSLLDAMTSNAGWNANQKQLVANDLIGWLTKSGYLKDGAAGKPAAGAKPGEAGFKDPVAERLDKIENDRKTEQQQRADTERQAHQKQVFDTKFMPKVGDLCKQKGVPKEDVPGYADSIAKEINGNKAILARIEAGNLVDVQRIFASIHNKEVARLQRWTASQTAAKKAQDRNPRIPAGGAPPAPAGSAKVNTRNRDDRIAAAADML